jgi:amidohydrolase
MSRDVVLERARRLRDRVVELRRLIHMNPELGYQEFKTAQLIADTLSSIGVKVKTGVAGTGVVGYLGNNGPVVALRADMDALPIQETNDVPYASKTPGCMHACGHDAHVAMLLTAAMLLKDVDLPGRVRLVFQPAEEGADGYPAGASRMIQEGVMDGVDAIFGLHVENDLPAGLIDCADGPIMAASDRFKAAIIGKAAHGAYSYKGVDAILLAAQVVQAMNHIVARSIPAQQSGVISVGTIQGGTKSNIIAGRVDLTGTIRSFRPEIRQTLFAKLEEACGVARALGGDYELVIVPGYPTTVNDPRMAALVRDTAQGLLNHGPMSSLMRDMGSEDFSFFAQRAPAAYFRLGTGMPGQPPRPGHNPTFDINEDALPVGVAMLAEVAGRYLRHKAAGAL